MRGCQAKRRGVVREVTLLEVRTPRDQQPDSRMLIAQYGQVQCGGFLKALAPQGTDQIGASVKALEQVGNISGLRGAEDGLDRFALDDGARVYALPIAGEQWLFSA